MSYNKKAWPYLILICLFCVTIFAHAKPSASTGLNQQIKPGQIPEGLSSSDWRSIQTQVKAGMYKTYSGDNGDYHSSNPAHGWRIHYGTDGTTTLRPLDRDTAIYYLGLKLSAIGYQTLELLQHPQQISSHDNTLNYHWNDILTERWVNSTMDLEQWFILNHRPRGAASGRSLTLQLTLDSDLIASQEDNNIRFVNRSGTTSITYKKLKVWDASGRQLPARMLLDARIQKLNLMIDDSSARYPLTIDPSFQQQAYVKAANSEVNDQFGRSVAIAGNTLVVGAPGEASSATGIDGDQSDNSVHGAGAAYVFTRIGSTWSQQAYLKASNTKGVDAFGISVAIAGSTVVVGAFREASNATEVDGDQRNNSAHGAGAAYVFTRIGSTWSQQAFLKASNTEIFDRFGFSVAIAGNTVVVGAMGEASNATGIDGDQSDNSADGAGAVYVFTRTGSTWSQQAFLKASNTEIFDRFGISVAIAGNTVVVGASREASNAIGINSDQSDNSADGAGAAYVFTRTGSTWSQQAYLKASNTEGTDGFGRSVAIAGNTMVVGAMGEASNTTGIDGDQSENSADSSGAVYVFTRNGSTWSQQAYLKASNPEVNDRFGISVSIADDTVVVGANGEDSNATRIDGDQSDNSENGAGAAYVFSRTGITWSQQAYLKASNSEGTDRFGIAVSIADDTVVVGANREASNATGVNGDQSDNSENGAGAAYVFNLAPSTTTECTLDVDGNASADALTDGLLFIRYMFGIRSLGLIDDSVANNCSHCSVAELEPILEQCGTAGTSDIDGNGAVDALTDGLLIIRYLFGIRGDSLIETSVAADCSRCTVLEIETYLQALMP
ncbi:MAG: FG-GAP repeat protein [Methylococcales bacterium]